MPFGKQDGIVNAHQLYGMKKNVADLEALELPVVTLARKKILIELSLHLTLLQRSGMVMLCIISVASQNHFSMCPVF